MPRSRVKRIYLPLGFTKNLAVTLRKFRTDPAKRAQHRRQFIHAINGGKYRELVIRIEPKKLKQKRVKQPKQQRWFQNQGIASLGLILLGFTGIIYGGLNLRTPATITLVGSNLASAAPVHEPPPPPAPKTLPKSRPMSLSIPKIQVDTSIMPVDLQPNGAVALPNSFWSAGWYDKSPTPGELGPSIIVGHVDSYKGIAIFWRLRELLPGDIVIVTRADGTKAVFQITALQQFSQASFPTQEVYGNINYAGIRLITCSGTFSTTTEHYDHNMVVFGRLI